MINNNDTIPAIVDLGIDPVTGARLYDLHECSKLYYDDDEIFDKLTGRNRHNNNVPNHPHSCWIEVLETTRSAKCPNVSNGGISVICSRWVPRELCLPMVEHQPHTNKPSY